MRLILTTMAAVAALSIAAPASGQWSHDRTYSSQLRLQIDAGVTQGTISRSEDNALRADLSQLLRLERRFRPNGISGREHAVLMQRTNALAKDIRAASRGTGLRGDRSAWDARPGNGNVAADPRFSGPQRGDRFIGDTRIGQRATARIVNLPTEYRRDYVDTAWIYHGYDNGRIYQIDRQSQMVLAFLDMAR